MKFLNWFRKKSQSVEDVANIERNVPSSLDIFFQDKLQEYADSKEEMLQHRNELLIEKFSKDVLLAKLNFTPHIKLHQFGAPIYFPQDLAQALEELTGIKINVEQIKYAVLTSAQKNCHWLDGDPIHAGSSTKGWKINCLFYKNYALVLSKSFNQLIYVDTEEVKVDTVRKVTVYGGEDNAGVYMARVIDISKSGIEIYRVEEYGYYREKKGRVFYSNFKQISNQEATENIKEFTDL